MRLQAKLAVLAGLAAVATGSSAQTTYTTEASFLAALVGPFYLEDFNDHTLGNPLNGSQTSWTSPGGNGYAWARTVAGVSIRAPAPFYEFSRTRSITLREAL